MTDTHDLNPGDTIELVHTNDPYTDLKPGARGTVHKIRDDEISVDWENGSTLSMIPSAGDRVRRVNSSQEGR